MVEESIRLANLDYKSHYFFYKQRKKECKYNIRSFEDNLLNINVTQNYDLLKCRNLTELVKIKTMSCRHLLHDDFWVKITKKDNKLDKIEDLQELNTMDDNSIAFVNTINSDDISNIAFLQFVDKINNSKFNGYSIELKYIDLDEDTENIKWIIIYCKKNIRYNYGA